MDVEFKDLSYSVTTNKWAMKRTEKVILRSVSGRFKSGELSAIMGPSGAGKSSLLNALSGYSSTGVQGTMFSNGSLRDERVFRSCSCYITQNDLLQPHMTLRELMMFAAKLKLPSITTDKQRQTMVSEIVDKLGLSQNENTFTQLLSGGQKKRLSVALELLNNPPVFFLDEPTSGLDNVSTKHCLKMLRSLAQQGRTIVCTIHQPSASLFELFDNVYVLSNGLCVYQGTTSGLLTFLSSVGLHCPLSYNPADYVIEITDGDEMNNVEVLSNAIENGKIIWKESDITEQTIISETEVDNHKMFKLDSSAFAMLSDSGEMKELRRPASLWTQYTALLGRMFLQLRRNKIALWIQLLHHLICASMIGIVFYKSADDGVKWFLHLKCVIGIVLFHAYTWTMVPILTYPEEVKLLKREHFNRWYGFNAYYMALTCVTLPSKLILTTIFLAIVYLSLGLPLEYLRITVFCVTGLMVSLISEGLGYAIGASFSVTNGAAIGPAVLSPLLGIAVYGFDFAKRVPLFTRFLMNLSFIRGSILTLVLATFSMDRKPLNCSDDLGFCHFQDPRVMLRMLTIEDLPVWEELLKLAGSLVFFRVILYFSLRRRLKT